MKLWSALLACLLAGGVLAQPSWMPLGREVERPYLQQVHGVGSTIHSAIRPYRRDDLLGTAADTLRQGAVLEVLDRWAGVGNGRKWRWGPLVDATAGLELNGASRTVHRLGAGFWLDADVHERLSFHLDAQGWDQRFANYLDTLVRATMVAPGEGFAFANGQRFNHYDVNGHVSWDAGKYFNLTMGRGRNSFGDGYRSLMLSDEAYGHPYLRVTTSFWRVKYVNLFSAMSDLRGVNGDPWDARRKYSSMHYLSWNATKRLNVALFEAILWNAGDSLYPRGFDVNYLNPIIFFRPVEFNVGSPDNALLGFSASYKVGKRALVYGQFVLDEFLLKEVRNRTGWWGNKQSGQLGVLVREPLGHQGLVVRAEVNIIRPFMYTHSDPVQNYSHFGQPLAHPYGSGMREVLVHADRDRGRWHMGLRASAARMGTDLEDSYGNNIFRPESERPRDEDGDRIERGYRIGKRRSLDLVHVLARGGFLLDPNTATRLELSYLFRWAEQEAGPTSMAHIFQVGVVCHFRQRYPEQQVRYVLQ